MPELSADLPLLQELTATEREQLAAIAEDRTHAAGSALLSQGTSAPDLIFVRRGSVRVSAILGAGDDAGAEEQVVVRLGPGEVVGELSFLTGEKANLSVLADEEASVTAIPIERLHAFLVDQPEIGRKLLLALARLLVRRLRQTGKELVLSRYYQRG